LKGNRFTVVAFFHVTAHSEYRVKQPFPPFLAAPYNFIVRQTNGRFTSISEP